MSERRVGNWGGTAKGRRAGACDEDDKEARRRKIVRRSRRKVERDERQNMAPNIVEAEVHEQEAEMASRANESRPRNS